MITPVLRTIGASYQKQLPPLPYTVIWQDVLLGNGEGRRTYDGTPYDFQDFVMSWPGGNRPGWDLQFMAGAFMEASPPGIHYIGMTIGGNWAIDYGLQEAPGGGGSNLSTPWISVPQGWSGDMYIYDGTNFADNAHFKFVDIYYRYIRS